MSKIFSLDSSALKNNTLYKKYELRRGKKRCLTMKKEYPLAHAKQHVQGD